MRVFLYILIFIISFILFFAYTFPIREVLGNLLASKGIKYKLVKGNIFNFEISKLEAKNLKIDKINIKNKILTLEVYINKKHQIKIFPLKKSANISIKRLRFENYQLKPELYGILNAKNKIKLKNGKFFINGKNDIFILKYKIGIVKNLNLISKINPDSNYNVLKANITSSYINGMFSGKLYLPLDFSKAYLEGNFSGKVFGSKANRKIKIKLLKILKGELNI